jgi:hypothetical protein
MARRLLWMLAGVLEASKSTILKKAARGPFD